jgi:uncharacterized protein YciI
MEESNTSEQQNRSERLPEVYALIWRSSEPDETYNQEEFNSRVPRLMTWLRDLHAQGKLVACGGGGFENHSGGLTLIRASSVEEAQVLADGTPMNEIGTTDILVWDVFYANLVQTTRQSQLVK